MRTHAIVELEEGALTVTLGRHDGTVPQVIRSRRVALVDLGRDAVASALRLVSKDMLSDVDGVHVVLGDPRTQHFVMALPKRPLAAIGESVMREALQRTGMPTAGEVLLAPRFVRRQPDGLVVSATALPRSVSEPIVDAFAANGVAVLGLCSMEACLALAAPERGAEQYAVLECSAGHVRFVSCDGRNAAFVHRFAIGSAESGHEAVASQLAKELPRTIDELRAAGHRPPAVLILGHRIDIGEESLDLGRGDVARIVCSPTAIVANEVINPPSLATMSLLQELGVRQPMPSLLQAPRLHLPPSRLRPAWLAAAVLLGCASTWAALEDLAARSVLRERRAQAIAERDGLVPMLIAANAANPSAAQGPDAERLAGVLGGRRPVSRLVAEVSNAANGSVLLDSLQFSNAERIEVAGTVRAASRAQALAALADFAGRVRALPYVEADDREDVAEAGGPNWLRFRLGLSWRKS